MAWVDSEGYMHDGQSPPGAKLWNGPPHPNWTNPTDIDQYGRKTGSPGAGGPAHGDLQPIPGQPPDPEPLHALMSGDAPPDPKIQAIMSNPPLQTQSTDPNGPNYVPPGKPQIMGIMAPTPEEIEAAARQQAYNNHFNYGGSPTGANDDAARYAKIGSDAQNRPGAVINTGRADAYGAQAQGNAAASGRVADLMWNRATGRTPSIAGMRADRDIGTLTAGQTSIAAGARGPAALALAQQQAAANTAQGTSTIANTAQINSAQERLDAEKNAFGAYSSMRGQDFQGQGLEQDRAKHQADLDAAQKAANDRLQLGMTGAEIDVKKAQLGAQGNQIGIEAGVNTANANRDQAGDQFGANRLDKWGIPIVGATAAGGGGALASWLLPGSKGGNGSGSGGVGGNTGGNGDTGDSGYGAPGSTPGGYNPDGSPAAGSGGGFDPDAKADGGPVQAGHPYLVGERGPELVIPKQAGHVVPAEETHALLQPTKHAPVERQEPADDGPTLHAALAGLEQLHKRVKSLEGGAGATHRRSAGAGMGGPSDGGDVESLGPSGEMNYDEPDYNFIKSGSPLDVATAKETHPGAISPQTEAYMRREGMWGDKTDALLRDRGLDHAHGDHPMTTRERALLDMAATMQDDSHPLMRGGR